MLHYKTQRKYVREISLGMFLQIQSDIYIYIYIYKIKCLHDFTDILFYLWEGGEDLHCYRKSTNSALAE